MALYGFFSPEMELWEQKNGIPSSTIYFMRVDGQSVPVNFIGGFVGGLPALGTIVGRPENPASYNFIGEIGSGGLRIASPPDRQQDARGVLGASTDRIGEPPKFSGFEPG